MLMPSCSFLVVHLVFFHVFGFGPPTKTFRFPSISSNSLVSIVVSPVARFLRQMSFNLLTDHSIGIHVSQCQSDYIAVLHTLHIFPGRYFEVPRSIVSIIFSDLSHLAASVRQPAVEPCLFLTNSHHLVLSPSTDHLCPIDSRVAIFHWCLNLLGCCLPLSHQVCLQALPLHFSSFSRESVNAGWHPCRSPRSHFPISAFHQ